jgi:hypothetical protein
MVRQDKQDTDFRKPSAVTPRFELEVVEIQWGVYCLTCPPNTVLLVDENRSLWGMATLRKLDYKLQVVG